MSENNEKVSLVKVEESIRFEIIELDDVALDAVSGGLRQAEPTNGSQCSCSNTIFC